jgi:hypothetical protein
MGLLTRFHYVVGIRFEVSVVVKLHILFLIIIINELTPRSRVLPEKLTGPQTNQEISRILWYPQVYYRI